MTGFTARALLAAGLLLLAQNALAVCKYNSIPATAPFSRFTDNGDGTLTDTATGLQWKRCSEGQVWDAAGETCTGTAITRTWQQALQLAADLNSAGGYAGQTDWRVPNSKELQSIVEEACYNPAIDLAAFPQTPSSVYWSASPFAEYSDSAWIVYFAYGYGGGFNKSSAYRVRLVRGGQ